MKKIISVLLVVVMILSILLVPAYAEEQTDTKQYKYYDKMVALVESSTLMWLNSYNEIYYHYSNENLDEPDWTLVYADVPGAMWDKKFGTNVGDRILYKGTGDELSLSGHHVFVTELDTFIPIEESEINKIIELCPDFVKVIEENGFGQLVGDIDENNVIDITDVTYIQRYLAGYRDLIDSYPIYYHISIKGSIDVSDFDRDGETTVLDATAIQRHIAGLE